jgi:hypothetical protein
VSEDIKARLQDHLISDLAQTSHQYAFNEGLEMLVRSFSQASIKQNLFHIVPSIVSH